MINGMTLRFKLVSFILLCNFLYNAIDLQQINVLLFFPLSSSQQRRFHETFDNVYEDVETVPKFSFAQSSFKCKAAPKSEYYASSTASVIES